MADPSRHQVFLLSPAHCGGKRARLLMNDRASFPLAERLRSPEGLPLGEAFSFLSGLYFRGKLAYAARFGAPQPGRPGALVITANRGLVPAAMAIGPADLREFGSVDIRADDERYREPLVRDASTLAEDADIAVVLLGSVATGKYVDVLLDIFGERLLFPVQFVGRGDMSRGALMLRAAREGTELDYQPVAGAVPQVEIPRDGRDATLSIGGKDVELTNLDKVFWPVEGYTKRDLLQYYADIASVILPHLRDRAITMKRYPHGITGEFFFMKRAPEHRPAWVETCSIMHKSKSMIAFPLAQDVPSLLWLINLGCIDLNQWYGTCDDPDRPYYLHFDLDPGEGAGLGKVLETACIVRTALEEYGMTPLVKTSGSSGVHVYVPIVRGPLQKAVWTFAKALAKRLERKHPDIITAEYRIADRPHGRVLVDYNQNAWGRTLASVYSVRPKPRATVSTPVTWDEVERGFRMEDFTIESVPARVRELGDLWQPLLEPRGRFPLATLL